MKKYCSNCGAVLLDGAASFCAECGKPVRECDREPAHAYDRDGYYDDVRPADDGHERERLDSELIKHIALVGGGAVLVIGAAVAVMLLF